MPVSQTLDGMLRDSSNPLPRKYEQSGRLAPRQHRYVMHVQLTKDQVKKLVDTFAKDSVDATVIAEGSSPMDNIVSMSLVPCDAELDQSV